MQENFWTFVQYGIDHVLDLKGYDHLFFVVLLAVPFVFKDWKRLLILISMFTLGHTLSLVLAIYDIVSVNGDLIEFLIPITILIAAIYNIFTARKRNSETNQGLLLFTALFFGLIHGLGFARYFNMIFDESESKLEFLLKFALGVEIAQVIIVFVVLILGFLCQTMFKFSRRDWIMVTSSIVIGGILPILIRFYFSK